MQMIGPLHKELRWRTGGGAVDELEVRRRSEGYEFCRTTRRLSSIAAKRLSSTSFMLHHILNPPSSENWTSSDTQDVGCCALQFNDEFARIRILCGIAALSCLP
jgi:hypothetical protein